MQLDYLLDVVTLGDVIGVLAAIGAVWTAIKWVKPALSQLGHFLADWNGEPERPGVEHRPGVMEQLSEPHRRGHSQNPSEGRRRVCS